MLIQFIRRWGRLLVLGLLFAALLGVGLFLNTILFPFILACFLAYVLAPLIYAIHQWKIRGHRIPRGAAVLIVYIVMLSLLTGGGWYLIPNLYREISQMLKEFPQAITQTSQIWLPRINQKLNDWLSLMPTSSQESLTPPESPSPPLNLDPKQSLPPLLTGVDQYRYEIRTLESGRYEITVHPKKNNGATKSLELQKYLPLLMQQAIERFKENLVQILNLGRQWLVKIADSLFATFLTLMVSAFILVDINRILSFGRSLLPQAYHQGYEHFLVRLDQGLNGVVRGQIMICLINGVLTFLGLIWIGVPFAFTLGLVATICSLIPIFGTFLSSFPIVVMALTVSLPTAVLSIGWVLLIHFIEGNFLNPKIMGTAAEIHPALVVFALMAGGHIAGIAGALLAVPIFSIIQTTFLFLKATIEELELSPMARPDQHHDLRSL